MQGGGGVNTAKKEWAVGELEFEALMRSLDNSVSLRHCFIVSTHEKSGQFGKMKKLFYCFYDPQFLLSFKLNERSTLGLLTH